VSGLSGEHGVDQSCSLKTENLAGDIQKMGTGGARSLREIPAFWE